MKRQPVPVLAVLFSVLAMFAGSVVAQPSSAVTRSRAMQVVDFPGSAENSNAPCYFTVMGAVKRSAVFHTTESKVPLGRLIEAAGGPTRLADGSICILREGRPRLQLTFAAAPEEAVYSGEMVVIPAKNSLQGAERSEASETIPIACAGLTDRPVVLPLDGRINSLSMLLAQLLQPPDLLDRTRIVHPPGRAAGEMFVAGTAVLFDPATVDRHALSIALATEPFPPSVSLDRTVAPQTVHGEQLPERDPAAVPPPLPSAPPTASVDGGSGTSSSELTQPLFSPEAAASQSVASVLRERAAEVSSAAAISESVDDRAEAETAVVKSLPDSETTRDPPSWIFADDRPASAINSKQPGRWDAVGDAPHPPAEDQKPELMDEGLEKNRPGSLLVSVLWIGLFAACCYGSWFAWSRRERIVKCVRWLRASVRSGKQTIVNADPLLNRLLDPGLPIVEGPVQLTDAAVLHGEPTGQLTLQIHEPHASLAGPHFTTPRAGESRRARLINERELRQRLRDAIQSRPVEQAFSHQQPSEQQTAMAPEAYDVVQPEDKPSAVKPLGPLERALRYHAQGQQQ